MIHHYLSRCDLFYKMGLDNTEYLELEITTMSNDVPMMSLQIHCDFTWFTPNATNTPMVPLGMILIQPW